jgi:hypothetical protein
LNEKSAWDSTSDLRAIKILLGTLLFVALQGSDGHCGQLGNLEDAIPTVSISWSSVSQVDTLIVTGSGYYTCYVRVDCGAYSHFFVGLEGRYFSSNGVHCHSVSPAFGEPLAWTNDADIDSTAIYNYLFVRYNDCPAISGVFTLMQVSIYVDVGQLDPGGGWWGPLDFLYPLQISLSDSENCPSYFWVFDPDSKTAKIVANLVPLGGASFGSIKALFR